MTLVAKGQGHLSGPTNNAPLINLRLSSDAEILLISTDWAYKLGPKCKKNRVCKVYIFRQSFHFAYHHWWLGNRTILVVHWLCFTPSFTRPLTCFKVIFFQLRERERERASLRKWTTCQESSPRWWWKEGRKEGWGMQYHHFPPPPKKKLAESDKNRKEVFLSILLF